MQTNSLIINQPIKRGYLSLEFIHRDMTYWLSTGCGRRDFCFIEVPLSCFSDHCLKADKLNGFKEPYSEIYVYSDEENGKIYYLFAAIVDGKTERLGFDVGDYNSLSWNELAYKMLCDGAILDDIIGLWKTHGLTSHIVRPKPDCSINIDKTICYHVTAFLPPISHEGIFAIIGENYKPTENPNWITIHRDTVEEYTNLLKQFDIVAIRFGEKYFDV